MYLKGTQIMKNLGLVCVSGILLSACSAATTAMLNPEASYLNGKKVQSVPKEQSITVVGSAYDESGNMMPSYPTPRIKEHKIVHLSPVPQSVFVACEIEYTKSAGHLSQNVKKYGYGMAMAEFQAGKTYMVFCNIQTNNRFNVVAREVPDGTSYQSAWSKPKTTEKPTDANRVRFEITGKSSQSLWRWADKLYMSIRSWDGKFGETAELAAPVNRVDVQCQMHGEVLNVPLIEHFQAGKTYRLACRKNDAGLMEAYIADTK